MLQQALIAARRLLGPRSNFRAAEQFGFSVIDNNGFEIAHELTGLRPDQDGFVWTPNRVVDQGLNYMLNAAFRGENVTTTWYIAPFAADVTPAANVTAATFASTLTEFTNYTEANRVQWVTDAAATAQQLINNAAPALFTIGSGGQTAIYGGGLLSVNGKGATTGFLGAAGKLANAMTGLAEGWEVRMKYRLTGSSS